MYQFEIYFNRGEQEIAEIAQRDHSLRYLRVLSFSAVNTSS